MPKPASKEGTVNIQVDFEVFGRVQKVFFRKYTQKKAVSLGVGGWCMNTSSGTVVGQLQGAPETVGHMKTWLRQEGSPKSVIQKTVFKNECRFDEQQLNGFEIRK